MIKCVEHDSHTYLVNFDVFQKLAEFVYDSNLLNINEWNLWENLRGWLILGTTIFS